MKRMMCVLVVLLSLLGGTMVGCDAAVEAPILDGLASGTTTIATALISAGFQTFMDDDGAGG